MNWKITANCGRRGPIFHKVEEHVVAQQRYMRILGVAWVQTRVNGTGTVFASVTLTNYAMTGRQVSVLSRHWKGKRAQTQMAKKWCEALLANPPTYVKTTWDSSFQMLNGVCKEQIRLAKEDSCGKLPVESL